jgi:hypothetical protein
MTKEDKHVRFPDLPPVRHDEAVLEQMFIDYSEVTRQIACDDNPPVDGLRNNFKARLRFYANLCLNKLLEQQTQQPRTYPVSVEVASQLQQARKAMAEMSTAVFDYKELRDSGKGDSDSLEQAWEEIEKTIPATDSWMIRDSQNVAGRVRVLKAAGVDQ